MQEIASSLTGWEDVDAGIAFNSISGFAHIAFPLLLDLGCFEFIQKEVEDM